MTTITRDSRPSLASMLTTEIRFGRADLHVETNRGEGEADLTTLLERIERRAELDVVAIADRDRIDSALEAREIATRDRLGFEVVPGLVVSTTDGPILGLWLEDGIAPGDSAATTIGAIHEAGGVAIVLYPFARWRRSIGQRILERLIADDDPAVQPDAIQITTGSTRASSGADRALELNAGRYHLPEVGASNAVFAERVASAYTLFPGTLRPGQRATELRTAIEVGTSRASRGRRAPLRQLGWRRVAEQRTREVRFASRRSMPAWLGGHVTGKSG
jgi:predicted metal-dependent phosphoesterase TrpH